MKSNVKRKSEVNSVTHEGGAAVKTTAEKELTRAVSCLMLFEDTFYEKGTDLASRISELCNKVSMDFLCKLAIKARVDLKLRHAPLWLMVQALTKKGTPEERNMVGHTISEVIRRADELAEILAIYWKDGRKKLPRQLKAGIAKAFPKFTEYDLAKYNRDATVKLRDALFLSHAKPEDKAQAKIWKKLIDGKLKTPDTWEVSLSGGADKKETFTRLIKEEKLGYMALLRNLRNMEEAGVEKKLVRKALMDGAKTSFALPFRFVAAARFAPSFADTLSDAMLISVERAEKLEGKTAILIDVSGSMDGQISEKSHMNRVDAACALAVLLREITPECRIWQFGDASREIPAHRGLGLVDAIKNNQVGHGTNIAGAIRDAMREFPLVERMLVITDMQHNGLVTLPQNCGFKGYYINVAPYEMAMPTFGGQWSIISGFSERIVDWVREEENESED